MIFTKNIFNNYIMPQKINMQVMNVPRVVRIRQAPAPSSTSMPNLNNRRLQMGSMGMVNRVRFAPAGCGSCGGR